MSRDRLRRASDSLRSAAEGSTDGDHVERLEDIAEQLGRLADAEHGPDHGRLARFENALLEITEDADDAVVDDVTAAHEQLKEYRSGVEGV